MYLWHVCILKVAINYVELEIEFENIIEIYASIVTFISSINANMTSL